MCLTCSILSGQIDFSFIILFKQPDVALWSLLAVDMVLHLGPFSLMSFDLI